MELLDRQGRPVSSVEFDEEVILRVHVQYHEDAAFSILGFSIRDKTGTDIVGSNTHEENVPLPPRLARRHGRRGFPSAAAAGQGTYSVSTALAYDRSKPSYFDWVDNALVLTVLPPESGKIIHGEGGLAGRHRGARPMNEPTTVESGGDRQEVETSLREEVENLGRIVDQQERTIADAQPRSRPASEGARMASAAAADSVAKVDAGGADSCADLSSAVSGARDLGRRRVLEDLQPRTGDKVSLALRGATFSSKARTAGSSHRGPVRAVDGVLRRAPSLADMAAAIELPPAPAD